MATHSGQSPRAGIRGFIALLLALFAVPLLDAVWPANLLVATVLASLALASLRQFVLGRSWALPTAVRATLVSRPHRATAMVSLAIAACIFLGSVTASILGSLRGRLASESALSPSIRMVQGASVAVGTTATPTGSAPAVAASPRMSHPGALEGAPDSPVAPRQPPAPALLPAPAPAISVATPQSAWANPSATPAMPSSVYIRGAATRPPSSSSAPTTPAAARPPSAYDRAYVERVIPIMETVQTELGVAARQGDVLRRDPSLASNPAWRSTTVASLARLRLAGQQLEHLGPVPPALAGLDVALAGFGQSLVAVARDYTRVVETGDVSHLDVAEADVTVAAVHLREVARLLQAAGGRSVGPTE